MILSSPRIREFILSAFWPSLWAREPRRASLSYPPEDKFFWLRDDGSDSESTPPKSPSYGSIDIRDLVGRDSCSAVFGSSASDAICVPSQTLCCVRDGQAYPSCQQHLGKGWCCLGDNATDSCYIDQPSVCDEAGSVPCTNLAKGVDQACCPAGTTCPPSHTVRDTVRCNIFFGDLVDAAASLTALSSTATSTSTSSLPSTVTESPSPTTSPPLQTTKILTSSDVLQSLPPNSVSSETVAATTSRTPTPSSTGQSRPSVTLPPSTMAGVIVGVVVAACLAIAAGWLLYRRRRRQIGESTHALPYPQGLPEKAHDSFRQGPIEMDIHTPRVYELEGAMRPF